MHFQDQSAVKVITLKFKTVIHYIMVTCTDSYIKSVRSEVGTEFIGRRMKNLTVQLEILQCL